MNSIGDINWENCYYIQSDIVVQKMSVEIAVLKFLHVGVFTKTFNTAPVFDLRVRGGVHFLHF